MLCHVMTRLGGGHSLYGNRYPVAIGTSIGHFYSVDIPLPCLLFASSVTKAKSIEHITGISYGTIIHFIASLYWLLPITRVVLQSEIFNQYSVNSFRAPRTRVVAVSWRLGCLGVTHEATVR